MLFRSKVGLSPKSIEALRRDTGRFDDPEEQLIYDYASTLLKKHAVDDALYERARAHFGTNLLIELTALIGYYCMVCSTLNAHNFDVPEGTAQPLPPL